MGEIFPLRARSHPLFFALHLFIGVIRRSPRSAREAAFQAVPCMSDLQRTTRPACVLGTPACPQCKDTGLESNGGFLTCATCGLAITRQALLQDTLALQLSIEPQ